MKGQGPHSDSEVSVISFKSARKRIQPAPDMTVEELRIFKDVVGSYAPSHFAESDKPLLTVYCAAVHLSRLYDEHDGNVTARRMRLETAKLVAMLANRLRLSAV